MIYTLCHVPELRDAWITRDWNPKVLLALFNSRPDADHGAWQPSPLYGDIYAVHPLGWLVNARHSARILEAKPGQYCFREVNGREQRFNQYRRVSLFPSGARPNRNLALHRLLCEAFHGPQPSLDHEVDHIDRCHWNNRAANLRWVTHAENMQNRNHPSVHIQRLTMEQRAQIIERWSRGATLHSLASEYGCTQPNLSYLTRQHATDEQRDRRRLNIPAHSGERRP